MNDLVKCNKCGHVLISISNANVIFWPETSIKCLKCGSDVVVKNKLKKEITNGKENLSSLG
jgi:hypothetical protein